MLLLFLVLVDSFVLLAKSSRVHTALVSSLHDPVPDFEGTFAAAEVSPVAFSDSEAETWPETSAL